MTRKQKIKELEREIDRLEERQKEKDKIAELKGKRFDLKYGGIIKSGKRISKNISDLAPPPKKKKRKKDDDPFDLGIYFSRLLN